MRVMKAQVVLFIVFFIVLVFILFCFIFLTPSFKEADSCSPFECGFSPFFSSSTPPFSMPFFVLSLMFLLFDVEIVLLLFFPFVFSFSYYSSFFLWFVALIVLFSTLYEWFKGLLIWL